MGFRVYSSHYCPACKLLEDWLRRNNIKFEEIFLEEADQETFKEIEKKKISSIPTVELDGKTILVGFPYDEKKLQEIFF